MSAQYEFILTEMAVHRPEHESLLNAVCNQLFIRILEHRVAAIEAEILSMNPTEPDFQTEAIPLFAIKTELKALLRFMEDQQAVLLNPTATE